MNALAETFHLPGFYWIAIEGQEAEEACWDGTQWLVAGSRTVIVGDVQVLTPRTAALPHDRLDSVLVGDSFH